nr:hypothetical protein [Clostridia bacterium]
MPLFLNPLSIELSPRHFITAVIVLLILWLLWRIGRLFRQYTRHQLIWSSGFERQVSDLNEQEARQHMRQIAQQHKHARRAKSGVIRSVHQSVYFRLKLLRYQLRKTPVEIIAIMPASLWVFENYHLLYRELKNFQAVGGSRRFSRLPRLNDGPAKGYPRVYALAKEIIAISYHLDAPLLRDLLMAYQEEQELSISELWAFQNILSLCLLEEIIRETQKILQTIKIKTKAESDLAKIMPLVLKREQDLTSILSGHLSDDLIRNPLYCVHLIHRLKTLSVDDAELLSWLNHQLGADQCPGNDWISYLVSQESRFEANSEALISALMTSLKTVSDLNWESLFSKVCKVDATLSSDPVYEKMTSESKSQYRAVIEKLSRQSQIPESQIAQEVVHLAAESSGDAKKGHVGYYLFPPGYYLLLDRLFGTGQRRRILDKLNWFVTRSAYFLFIVAALTVILFLSDHFLIRPFGAGRTAEVVLLIFLFLPACDLGIFLANFIFTRLVKPKPLPALDFTSYIPEECRTFVVMPVIINKPEQVLTYARKLEIYYLANRHKNLHFALLVDYPDAEKEIMPEDEVILKLSIEAISELNSRYIDKPSRFYLFTRPRKWNPSQNCWMGWERKRGKLEAFNAFLCGEANPGIDLIIGDEEIIKKVRYIITLDADTELLRDGAAQLIGIMAHPLNKPCIDPVKNRITEGYAIVQSEIRTRISSQSASLFAKFFSGQAGIDPYASVVSDLYQDLFSEGIYTGKGIYDLLVFHRLLGGVIPENSVLSHDLLEGSLARCAFASKVKLLDSCPASVISYAQREHRWIRGDWQLLPWIFSKSAINGLSRWKMIDNLRRSLKWPALLSLLFVNILLLPDQFWLSLIFCFAEPILLIAQYLIRLIWRRILNPTARFARRVIYEQLSTLVVQPLLNFILLPYRAYLALDAIIRTIYRLLISKRNLLEWQTAEAIEMNLQNRLSDDYKRMAFSPMAGLVLLVLSWIQVRPPVLIFWLAVSFSFVLSPLFSWLISRQKRHAAKFISAAQLSELRLTARRIWRFFEEQMKNENHWLCPDCFQEYPGPKIADKTSPTNIGLQLLALLSARDLGYVSLLRMLELCDRIVLTIESLPKWNGHLFNWYNIKTLQVLNPRYVSTVDSGNFAAHFLTLKQGLISEKTAPIFKSSDLLGLNDTCLLAGWSKEDLKDEIHSEKDFEAYLTFILEQTPTPCDPAFLALARNLCREFLEEQQRFKGSGYPGNHVSLQQLAKDGNEAAEKYIRLIHSLVNSIDRIVQDINFKILYDPDVHLFHIGYNVATQTADASHYDLLASEARTASLFAIAKGDVPQKHWFRLGRPLTMVRGIPTSVSWSGSMFEYLMPNLIMKSPLGSFMQQSCRAAVLCQIRYGKKMKMPWGVSESQYYRFDTNSNYQYGPFGIPKLRLQATLRPARVIAPYATMLALYTLPRKALQNISVLRKCKAEKDYGFYEALDFNHPDPERLQPFSLVRSFMAHHQGMSLVSINNLLNQNIMPKRFHEEPLIQSAEFLLEEKQSEPIVALARRGYTISADLEEFSEKSIESRIISKYNLIQPICHVLSNNHYVLMQTSDGAGYSRCDRWMVTRWNPDFIRYSAGTFIYVKNQTTQQVWSTSYLPTRVEPEEYQAIFHHDHIEYNRLDGAIQTTTRITISPHEHFEIRRVTLTNHGIQPVEIELTSYLEAVADEMMADFMHPAFSKLFLQTEYVADQNLLIAERRKRSAQDPSRYVYHLLIPEGRLTRPVQFTTDRKSFIGRGGSLAKPITISNEIPLNGQVGFSRDTIFSLRAIMRLPARGKMSVSFVTGFCSNRNDIQNISRDLHRPFQIMDLFKRALTSSELELKYLNISSHQLNAAQNLISYLYFPEAIHPEQQSALKQLKLSQSGLWRFGISGDYPLILLKVQSVSELPIIRDVLLAYEYLKLNQVDTDLVIINEEPASYAQELEHRLRELTANLKIYSRGENKPSLFILPRHFISDEEYHLLLSVSRVILDGKSGLYAHTISPRVQDKRNPKVGDQSVIPLLPGPPLPIGGKIQKPLLEDHLEYFNGFGGFANLGQEYEILPSAERITPMPWINVIANENFGFLISEIGAGYTWADNSRENKLSGWSNDPILDPASE